MKHLVRLSGLAVAVIALFTACENGEINVSQSNIEGVFEGSLSGILPHSTSGIIESIPSTTEITQFDENLVQIHCSSENFDTTFVMNYYYHNDSAYVCHTGNDFEEMYGHKLGEGHMDGMMDDVQNGESEWMHHLNEEHNKGDDHFGGFDIAAHSFSFTFQMDRSDSSDDLHFEGTKP